MACFVLSRSTLHVGTLNSISINELCQASDLKRAIHGHNEELGLLVVIYSAVCLLSNE